MCGSVKATVLIVICVALTLFILSSDTEAQDTFFKVTIDSPENGSIELEPAVPSDGKVAAGTVIRVTASPDKGFAFDGGYYAMPGRWGKMYYESMTPVFNVVMDSDKSIGASFIEKEKLEGFRVIQDVVYAQPGVKKLKYDVFIPDGAKKLPGIVVIHGGGWSTNTEDIMRGLARELVRGGHYVVFSIDYRWIGNADGDKVPNTMADLIGDVFGAIAHIQEHAAGYGCDPERIAVTGDSAGGHLSAVAANMCTKIGDGGFGTAPGVFEFLPSYMPAGKTVSQVRGDISRAVQAAAPSYGVFDGAMLQSFIGTEDSSWADAVAPIKNIPEAKEREVPQYLTRGSLDVLITDEAVRAYAEALEAAGQKVKYDVVEGANHAFFDWKPDTQTKSVFAEFGVPYAASMKAFFDAVFYPEGQ
ncbi:MAG: alpha/beta fold hydrolase [Acidobacteriota bacterium]